MLKLSLFASNALDKMAQESPIYAQKVAHFAARELVAWATFVGVS
jgi:hypothetical protein